MTKPKTDLIRKRALELASARRSRPQSKAASNSSTQYLQQRKPKTVVLRCPPDIHEAVIGALSAPRAVGTINTYAIAATEQLLARPPRSFTDFDLKEFIKLSMRWPEDLVTQLDKLVKEHGGPRPPGVSRNTIILAALKKATNHS